MHTSAYQPVSTGRVCRFATMFCAVSAQFPGSPARLGCRRMSKKSVVGKRREDVGGCLGMKMKDRVDIPARRRGWQQLPAGC